MRTRSWTIGLKIAAGVFATAAVCSVGATPRPAAAAAPQVARSSTSLQIESAQSPAQLVARCGSPCGLSSLKLVAGQALFG